MLWLPGRALVSAREDLILGFGSAPLTAAAGSFASTPSADFTPGRHAAASSSGSSDDDEGSEAPLELELAFDEHGRVAGVGGAALNFEPRSYCDAIQLEQTVIYNTSARNDQCNCIGMFPVPDVTCLSELFRFGQRDGFHAAKRAYSNGSIFP